MPFNIPVEEDRSGEMLGQGLANAMMMYRQGREMQRTRAEHDQDRAHMLETQHLADAIQQENARQSGITPGTAPHENLDITVPDGLPPSTDHLPFESAMQPHPQGLASALGDQFNRAGSVRAPSPGPTVPGAFSMAGGGFHSPLKEKMSSAQPMGGGEPGGDQGFQKRPMPGTDPGFQERPQDGPSHTLHMAPSYQQLTPEYYMDRTAPGPVGAALARELGQRKTEAEIGELTARGKYYSEHGDYYEQGGYRGGGGAGGAPHTLRTPNGYMLWDPQSRTYIPIDDENGKPVMPVLARPSTAAPLAVRGARSSASASRQDATSFDRLANAFEKPLNDPTTQIAGDTTGFPARRDSVSKYRGKADSARAVAAGYDAEANAGSGVAPPVLSGQRPNFSDARSGSSAAAGAPPPAKPKYTRHQVDSLYQDALARGADPTKAKARRDQLLKTAQ